MSQFFTEICNTLKIVNFLCFSRLNLWFEPGRGDPESKFGETFGFALFRQGSFSFVVRMRRSLLPAQETGRNSASCQLAVCKKAPTLLLVKSSLFATDLS